MKNGEFQNILVINFGQIGDVISSLPAMKLIREGYSKSKITVLIGLTADAIFEMSDAFDEKIVVDRVALRDSNKFWSLAQIVKLVRDVRRRKFDLVIDLHSLYETNLLGFFSGSRNRLFARRANRSLDFLSNVRPRPPEYNHAQPLSRGYLDVLKPLGLKALESDIRIHPAAIDLNYVEGIFKSDKIENKKLVGINLGAGNPSRCWSIENFAALSRMISLQDGIQILVFFGPEEKPRRNRIYELFSPTAIIYEEFTLQQLAAAFSFLKILIGNDTGPLHLGSAVGTKVLYVMGKDGPLTYIPAGSNVRIVGSSTKLEEIDVDEVFQAAQKLL